MEDKLKQWVSSQREEFEIHDFDLDAGWDKISEGINGKAIEKNTRKRRWLSIAAAVLVLIVAGGILVPSMIGGNDSDQNIFSENSELAEASEYYTSEINYRLAAARELVDDQSVFEDLDELDRAFAELKNDLKDNADNEEVVIAMMENYQLKLKILDRILKELRKDQKGEEQYEQI
ncbi:MAG: hypothetical protein AAFQ94_27720 [Bacteroidota bacterium]